MKPRLLDLFSGAGGSAKGYQRAGFHVTGVDINAQPNYCGDAFFQADAMTFPLEGFDAVHASPPCQDHSVLSSLQAAHGTGWMLAATLDRLGVAGLSFVVENVVGASLTNCVTLCGSSFGLGVRRHRRFQTNWDVWAPPPCQHQIQPAPIDVTGGGPSKGPRLDGKGGRSRKPRNMAEANAAMGIDWMTRAELNEAIPPAYTTWLGDQLLLALGVCASSTRKEPEE